MPWKSLEYRGYGQPTGLLLTAAAKTLKILYPKITQLKVLTTRIIYDNNLTRKETKIKL